jgi:hypothetical protein
MEPHYSDCLHDGDQLSDEGGEHAHSAPSFSQAIIDRKSIQDQNPSVYQNRSRRKRDFKKRFCYYMSE